jgi:SNF2 family DNA or RNA helicase
VFSQSLESLRLIERVLKNLENGWFDDNHIAAAKGANETWKWKRGTDYFVIDGSVSSADRDSIQKKFNRQNTARSRMCLISTKAGSLGTTFTGANRVVVFDQNWVSLFFEGIFKVSVCFTNF